MRRAPILLAVLGFLAAACGGDGGGEVAETTPTTGGFVLTSRAFTDGALIPEQYALEGGNTRIPVAWSGVPAGAVELVLVMEDPDAPGGTFVHWLVAGIDPARTGLEEGTEATPEGVATGRSDSSLTQYWGPDPPEGESHHYVLTLYALKERTGLSTAFERADLEPILSGDGVLGQAQLTGVFP